MRAFVAPLLVLALFALPVGAGEADDARAAAFAGEHEKAVLLARAALAKDGGDLASGRLLQDTLVALGRRAEAEAVADTEGLAPATVRHLRARFADPRAAVDVFRKMRSEEGASPLVRLDFARALLASGSAAAAETEAKALLKEDAQDVEASVLLARSFVARDNPKAARPVLEQALVARPGSAPAALLLADVLHALGDARRAREVLLEALAVHSSHPEIRVGLVQDQCRVGDYVSAEATAQALATDRASWAPSHAWVAYVKRRLGRLEEAEQAARKAIAIDEGNVLARETLGFVLLRREDIDGAMENYGRALREDPTRIEPYVGLAYAQALAGEFEYAQDMLEKALKIDKDDLEANLKMGIVLFLRGQNRTAKRHLQNALRLDPDSVPAQRYLGYVVLGEGKAKEALDILTKALSAGPEDAMTVRMIGRALFDLGRKDDARERFEHAVALDEKDAWAHFDLGKCLDDMEEYALARASFEKAIELDPDFSWPNLYLAELLDEVENDQEAALPHYKRFLELGGPDPDGEVESRISQIEK